MDNTHELTPLLNLILLEQWRLSIFGTFLLAFGQMKYMIVVADCFTKLGGSRISCHHFHPNKLFYSWGIECGFGLPWSTVTDNGLQF